MNTNQNISEGDTPLPHSPVDRDTAYRLDQAPEKWRPDMTWSERRDQWKLVHHAAWFAERPEVRVGQEGEAHTRHLLNAYLGITGCRVYANKRVPRDMKAQAMGRREIDYIVVTPRRVIVLEVKNWRGRLALEDEQWVHHRRQGEIRVYNNLAAHHRDKVEALQTYLRHCGVSLSPERFSQAVLFTDRSLDLDPEIRSMAGVLTPDGLGMMLGADARKSDSATTTPNLSAMPPGQENAVRDAIEKLRSWDRLTLRGGRVLQGDVLWLELDGNRLPANSLVSGSAVELRWSRGWWGWCKTFAVERPLGVAVGNLLSDQDGLPRRALPLDVGDCVCFQEVGQAQPSLIALRSADRLQIG